MWISLYILFAFSALSMFARTYRMAAFPVVAVTGLNIWFQSLIHALAGEVGQFYALGLTDGITGLFLCWVAYRKFAPKTAYLTAIIIALGIATNVAMAVKIKTPIHGSISWYFNTITMLNILEAFTFIGGVLDGLANIYHGLRRGLFPQMAHRDFSRRSGVGHSRISRW